MPNVVNIIVKSTDLTKSGFDSAKHGLKLIEEAAMAAGVAITTALAGIVVKSVQMAATFDSEMMKLVTQAGVAKDQLGVLSKGVLDLAGKVGQSPDSLAQALFHVESNFASLGISSQKALELVKIAAEGASVGGADLVDVTNALTAAVASGIPGVEDFSKAMGVLNATVGAGDMTMQDLSKALGTGVLAVVKGYGLSIKDVSAALATFGDNNIRGQKAATDLRMAVQSLAVPAKDGVALLAKWGYQADTLAKDMQQHGLLFALQHLQEMFKANGVTAKEQGDIITQMFGKKAGAGLAILLGQMDRLESKYPDLAKGADGFSQAWENTNKTLKQQWNDIKAGFDSMMIRIGERLTPLIQNAIPRFVDAWNWVKNAFIQLNEVFHFDVMFKKIEDASRQFVEEFKKDWPQIKPIVVIAAFFIGLLVEGILGLLFVLIKLDTAALPIWEGLAAVIVQFVHNALAALKWFADAAAATFGWVPGLGPKLKEAAKKVDDFVAHANHALDSLINPTVTVTVVAQTVGSLAGQIVQSLGSSQQIHIRGNAMGGIASGLTMVGERGIELVRLPTGSHVLPNGNVGGALAAGGDAKVQTTIDFAGNLNTPFAIWFMNALRSGDIIIRQKYIRT